MIKCVQVGTGIIAVSYSMLSEFFENKPSTLDVIGIVDSLDPNHSRAYLTVRGPEIPTIPGPFGIPHLDLVITTLEDGSWEWDFRPADLRKA